MAQDQNTQNTLFFLQLKYMAFESQTSTQTGPPFNAPGQSKFIPHMISGKKP